MFRMLVQKQLPAEKIILNVILENMYVHFVWLKRNRRTRVKIFCLKMIGRFVNAQSEREICASDSQTKTTEYSCYLEEKEILLNNRLRTYSEIMYMYQ